MPGKNLSRNEEKLAKEWRGPNQTRYPRLKGISICGGGLRGIENLEIDFKYPVSAICGKNGNNKTTVLSICALGFHSPEHHMVYRPRLTVSEDHEAYYRFEDFFFKGPGDPEYSSIEIKWRYDNVDELVLKKEIGLDWMVYENRPKRPVDYIGVMRTIPAAEENAIRSAFTSYKENEFEEDLEDEYLDRMAEIMGRPYTKIQEVPFGAQKVRTCSADGSYSSFNMGAGEDVITELLFLLQEAHKGSLIVIEEIEIGIHPQALRRLAKHMIEIALDKKLQIIVSTHSSDFLDALPQDARIYLERASSQHRVVYSPTTNFAMGELSGILSHDLQIYCEDDFAAGLINKLLPSHIRKRSKVTPIGSSTVLAIQAVSHIRSGFKANALVVWDGDVKLSDIRKWINKASGGNKSLVDSVNWVKLPGDLPPERWVADKLQDTQGHKILARKLRKEKNEVGNLLSTLFTTREHHSLSYVLGVSEGFDNSEAKMILYDAILDHSFDEFSNLIDASEISLNGGAFYGEGPEQA